VTTRTDEGEDTGPVDMGFHYSVTGRAPTLQPITPPGDVTLADFAIFQTCFTGSYTSSIEEKCLRFDVFADQDVDLDDFTLFQRFLDSP
jgi:hypothetical protein